MKTRRNNYTFSSKANYKNEEDDDDTEVESNEIKIQGNNIYLYSDITQDIALQFNLEIKKLETKLLIMSIEYDCPIPEIKIHINSEGGEIFAAMAMVDTIKLCKVPITTIVEGQAASAATLRATKAVRFASSPTPGTFSVDEEINQATTGAVGKVVEWDSVNRILYYIQTRFNDEGVDSNGNLTNFSAGNVITGQGGTSPTGTPDTTDSSTVNGTTFASGYSVSELDADDGDIIYLENRAPITRATDQTENIKLIVEF